MAKKNTQQPQEQFKTMIGGQALIEGIMMLGPEKSAVVVRTKDGLQRKVEPRKLSQKWSPKKLPFIRGIFNFCTSMKTGVSALMYSADFFAEEDEDEKGKEPGRFEAWLEKRLSSEKAQNAHALGCVGHGPAFISVHPALHHGHRLAGQAAEDQLSFVSRGGGMFKMGNLPVGDHHGVLHQVPQIPQAGAQNHGHLGPEPSQLGLQSVRAFPILGKGIIHSISSISGPRPCFFPGPRPGFPSSILGYLTPTARKNQIKSLALQGFFPLGGGRGRDFSPAPPLSRQNRRAAVFLLAISCQSVL